MRMLSWFRLVVCVLPCFLVPRVTCFTRDRESALRTLVLRGYNSEVRPDPVTKVFMLFHVTSIADVDIRNEIFSVSGYWSMRWVDDRLTWNSTDYPKIPVMQIKESRIWTPVIVVSNSIKNLSAIAESSIPVRVDRDGTVSWSPPGLLRLSCTMDISHFPFDTQTCGIEITSFGYTIQMQLGQHLIALTVEDLGAVAESSIPVRVDRDGTVSWSPPGLLRLSCTMDISHFPFDTQTCGIEITSFGYTIQEMDVKIFSDGLSFRYYSPSGEWDIIRTYSVQSTYDEDGYTFARVTFYFKIQRKPLYYGLNMLLPVIICSALSIFVFLLPADSGEKIGYCLTVLLAFMVILTLVADELPTTASSTSILQIYIAVVLLMGGLSVILSIYVLHLFHQPEDKPVGPRAQALTHFLMKLSCHEACCPAASRVEPGRGVGARTPSASGWERDAYSISSPPPINDPLTPPWRIQPPPLETDAANILAEMKASSSVYPRDGSFFHLRGGHDIPRVNKHNISVTPMPQNPQRPRYEEPETPLTWQIVSKTLDGALLRLYMLFLIGSSIVFVAILMTGG